MSWKDKVKSVFLEEENTEKKQIPATAPVSAPIQSSVQIQSLPDNGEVEIDEKLLDLLESKIKGADIPGPDYLELKDAAEEASFVAEEPDEAKRWKQSYRNMKTYFPQAGITKKKILSAIDHYIGIVREEINTGKAELKALREKNVNQEQTAVANLEAEIKKLEDQLSDKRQQLQYRTSKIEESRQKYDHQEKVFDKTIQFVLSLLEGDKQKINNYIAE